MEPATRIERAASAYEAGALPLSAALGTEPTAGADPASAAYQALARPSCRAGVRTLGRIRTGTVDVLNVGPLPLGYEGKCWERRIRTSTVLLQRQASCRLDQLPIAAGGLPMTEASIERQRGLEPRHPAWKAGALPG